MFRLLCVCIFVAKYANGFQHYDFNNEMTNNDIEDYRRQLLSYFQESSWSSYTPMRFGYSFGSSYETPITIIEYPTIDRTYRTEINVQQSTHPYLFQIMQMIPIKGQISFNYIYQKLFQYYLALQKFRPTYQTLNFETIAQILQFVFPELGNKVYEIVKYPMGPPMLRALFEMIFPGMSKADIDLIFRNAQTINDVIINLVLYLCPTIRNDFQWDEDLPTNEKLNTILRILFPGETSNQLLNGNFQQGNFQNNMYNFLESLFQGNLIPKSSTALQKPTPNGPEWTDFLTLLYENNIDYQTLPKEILFNLFSHFNTPQFNFYLTKFKNQTKKPNQMDRNMVIVWTQFLNDLKNHKITINDMPPEIKVFLQQHQNPQELMKILTDSIGLPGDLSSIQLNPQTMELGKNFIFDIMSHKGDITHFPKQLLDFFNTPSQKPSSNPLLDNIFNGVSINPKIAVKWHPFFDKLRNGLTTLDQLPSDLRTSLMNLQHPEEFLRTILKLKDSNINTDFLQIDTNPHMLALWKKYIQDVAANKGNIRNIPQELLQYFYKLSANPENAEYIKHLFSPDQINPKTLNTWKQFVNDLKSHKVDLKDMPSEIIQLMSKYQSPDEFFKVFLPQANIPVNMDVTPDETVKDQWNHWILNLQNHNANVLETPKELKDFIQKLSDSKDYLTTLKEINSINPDLLMKWKQFVTDLKSHRVDLKDMPSEIIQLMSKYRSPDEFFKVFLPQTNVPVNMDVTPDETVKDQWNHWIFNLQNHNASVLETPKELKDFFTKLSPSKDYQTTLKDINFFNPDLLMKWKQFVTDLKSHRVDLKDMPSEIIQLMLKYKSPDEFFKVFLPQTNVPVNMDVTPDETVKDQWNHWIHNLQNHKASVLETPKELKDFIQKLSPSKDYQTTLKDINSISPDLLLKWKQFVTDLRSHRVDLKDMPSEIIQLMSKYRSPDEFFKVFLPQTNVPVNMDVTPDETVKDQWNHWIHNLQNHKASVLETPKELKDFIQKLSDSKDYLTTLKEINSISPDLLMKWKQFVTDLKSHRVDLKAMPSEIIQLMSKYKSPDEFFKVFLPQTNVPVNMDVTPDETVKDQWNHWIFNLQNHNASVLETPKELKDFFTKLSPSKDYQTTLKDINFFNPDLLMKWKQFVTDLKSHRVDLKDMPSEIIQLMSKYKSPDEFFKVFLPQTNVPVNMDVTPDETVKDQWNNWIHNLQNHKASVLETPKELKDFIQKLSDSKDYLTTLKEINSISPDLLMKWKQFVTDLKSHRVDLKAMPSEIIQLMSKYKSPDDFFKVFLPQTNVPVNMDVTPDETVKDQWNHWISNLQNRNASVFETPKELKDFIQKLSPSKDYQTTLQEIDSINPDLLTKWKQFMGDLEQHKKSLYTMPQDLKKYLFEMKTPQEFVNLIFKTLSPPLNDLIPTPTENLTSDWKRFVESIKEDYLLDGEVIDGVPFPYALSEYLVNASNDVNYKHAINNIYQMDAYQKTGFEDFIEKMHHDYYLNLVGLPEKLFYFFAKFEYFPDMFRSILAWYPNYEIKKNIAEDPELGMLWAITLDNLMINKTEIPPLFKLLMKYLTKDTPLESQIDEVIKLHESNALVSRVEKFWSEAKNEVKVHDGLEVFLQFLDKLGYYYGSSEELCDERSRILKTLDRVRKGFAAKSECTANKVFAD